MPSRDAQAVAMRTFRFPRLLVMLVSDGNRESDTAATYLGTDPFSETSDMSLCELRAV